MSAEVTSAASIGVLASGVATVWPSGKNDPFRSFGMRSCTSPAWVASSR